jgi:formylglycine-generating enzyme required for sulfatase activity
MTGRFASLVFLTSALSSCSEAADPTGADALPRPGDAAGMGPEHSAAGAARAGNAARVRDSWQASGGSDGAADHVADASGGGAPAVIRKGPLHEWASAPAGTYSMGTPSDRTVCGNETQRDVTLNQSFEIARDEVTEGSFASLMGYRPSSVCDECPVANLTWNEAAAYCNALSHTEAGSEVEHCYECSGTGAAVKCSEEASYAGEAIYTCPGFRLPTEAEWEYAYRAGTTSDLYVGDFTHAFSCELTAIPAPGNAELAARVAVYGGHAAPERDRTFPVRQKEPNAWGLYDMAGNVWNWIHDPCQDELGPEPVTNPVGAGTTRRVRGGSYHYGVAALRAADRGSCGLNGDQFRSPATGFRCVRSLVGSANNED